MDGPEAPISVSTCRQIIDTEIPAFVRKPSTAHPMYWNYYLVITHGHSCSCQLNIWDVGGQKSLRSYWRNYFEQTDAMIWVVDSADLWRLEDCKKELHNLLKQERLAGATLLILANKQDQGNALSGQKIEEARPGLAQGSLNMQ